MSAWTDETLGRAARVLARHETVKAACEELGVSPFNLCHAFGRYGFGLPKDYLQRGSPSRGAGSAAVEPEQRSRNAPENFFEDSAPAPGGCTSIQGLAGVLEKPTGPAIPQAAPERSPSQIVEETLAERNARRLRAENAALVDELREAQAQARFAASLGATPITPRILARESASSAREATAIALASDWHVEEIVRPEAVAERNAYDLSVAKRRAEKFFSSIRWMLNFERQAFTLRDLVLWLGGDLITGYIHEELVESNELAPVEAVLFVQQLLADGIATLLADPQLERIVIPCSYGNHGRVTDKRRIKTGAQNSFEWLMYQQLARLFANEPRVQFVIAESAHQYLDVYRYTLHFHHGDDVRYAGGVGGLTIPLNKRIAQWNGVRRADYHHVGHFHSFTDLGHAVVNGSLIGYTDYAMSIGAQYEPPQQAFYVLDAKRGKCLTTPLWVDDTDDVREVA